MSIAAEAEVDLVDALRRGDEQAFIELVERYQGSMLRVSRSLVSSPMVAEEVVQEAWVGVLQGLDRFEGRASLKTWILRIVTNIAVRRAERERRTVAFSALGADSQAGPSVAAERFRDARDRWPGHWASEPSDWSAIPEERLLSRETLSRVATAIEALSPNQRAVITLRDVEGLRSEEVCDFLSITEANQRVLLHRARSRVRAALERYIIGSQS